jgi:glycosyltransferase involved in cell wall biosynthesis
MHPLWWLNNWWIRKFLKSARSDNFVKIIAISRVLAEIWRKRGIPPQKILVLHDGVSLDDYKDLKSREAARAELGIKDKKKIVTYVGSLYEDRGIGDILKLAQLFPAVHFMVVGGPEKNKLDYEAKARCDGLANIVFTGRVPHHQVKDYLLAADILLMLWSRQVPTIRVCSPLKVFEYMAAERIIVGHGFPTIREVLKDGETAFLADPDSFEDLKIKMSHALALDYPNDMAKKARKVVLQNYTWESRAKAIVDALSASHS